MNGYTVFDIETTGDLPWRDNLVAVGIGGKVWRPAEGTRMARLLLQQEKTIVCHTNYDLRWLCLDGAKLGDKVQFHDTKVMAWMLDATQELALDALAARYLGYVPPKPIKRVRGRIMFQARDGLMPIEDVPWEEMETYNRSDLDTEAELYEHLRARLQERGLWQLFLEEEAPFSRLLVEMESEGLPFDSERAAEQLVVNEAHAEQAREWLVEGTGAIEFNPGSHDQVKTFLYSDGWRAPVRFAIPRLVKMSAEEKMEAVLKIAPPGVRVERVGREYAYGYQPLDGLGLKPLKRKDPKTRTKKTTVSGKLLAIEYGGIPWVSTYVEWKRIEKINGYLRDWIEREHKGRLHARFDQSGTATGRLSSKEPNLQQVANGDDIRDLFRGPLVVGDYGGLEARLAAHFSGDPVMLDVFRNGRDLYGVMAAETWPGAADKSHPRRNLMKYAWLSSQYGAMGETLKMAMLIAAMQGKSNQDDIDIVRAFTPKQADDLVDQIRRVVPRMFDWREEVVTEARALGYVTTLAGRKRHLADIDSADWFKMATAERQAVNSKVQGSAADVVRRAMLRLRYVIPRDAVKISLQVHDELLLLRGPAWDESWYPRIVQICEEEHGFDLIVPLVFECTVAESWAAKGGSVGPSIEDALELEGART